MIMGQLTEEQTEKAPKGIKGEKKFRGKLLEANNEGFTIEVKNFPLKLEYKQLKKANLDPDLKSDKG